MKGSVDEINKKCSMYTYSHQSRCCTMTIFHSIVDISSVNFHSLYDIHMGRQTSREIFMKEISSAVSIREN